MTPILVGGVVGKFSRSRVAAIVLAAGASRRFGTPKQLVPWQGQPLLRHVLWQVLAAQVDEVVVTLGAYADQVAPVVHGLPVTLVIHRDWAQGMSTSVRTGLRALRTEPDAALFVLADQPGLTPAWIHRILRVYETIHAGIVAPRAGERPGNPVLFDRVFFPELMKITGDQGGRVVMRAHPQAIHWLEADPSLLWDIDFPEDLFRK